MRIAVIGAGLAGLTAARTLHDDGHSVVVWEKARGPGGRTSTRRGPDGMRFDHGAPFLHDGPLALEGLEALGTYAVNLPGGAVRREVVGIPSANAPAKALAHGLDVRPLARVETILRAGDGWHLAGEDGGALGSFDSVIVTAPAPQAAQLLAGAAPRLAARAADVEFAPCWSVMAAWGSPLDLGFTATEDIPGIACAVADGAKPGRTAGERWVLQADEDLSTAYLDVDADEVIDLLLARWFERVGRRADPVHVTAHRWRYARPRTPLPETYLREDTLLVAGDWCGGASAGAAVRSGADAAAALVAA